MTPRFAHLLALLLAIDATFAWHAAARSDDRRFTIHRGDGKLHNPGPCARAHDMYAKGSEQIWNCVTGGNKFRFISPAGRSTVVAQFLDADREGIDEPLVMELSGAIGVRRLQFAPVGAAEMAWRSDERALFLNISTGGANGPYDAIVMLPVRGRLERRNLSDLVRQRFGDPMRCGESPNVGAVGWLSNGNVLIAAEIVHHSFCDSYGTFRAYEVDPLAMWIVREYGQMEAKRRFRALLGSELIQARDRCVQEPKKCTIAYLQKHPEQGW